MTKLDITNLSQSLKTLKNSYNLYEKAQDEIYKQALRDSCVKRFEYTYETAKKIMNKYLKYEFDKSDLKINDVFRQMYGLNLIASFENWGLYREKRNDTTHEYNSFKSNEVINILNIFIQDCEFLINELNKDLNK